MRNLYKCNKCGYILNVDELQCSECTDGHFEKYTEPIHPQVVDLSKYPMCEVDPTLQNNLMAFGLDCGAGWHPLIKELLDKLQNYVNRFPQLVNFRITQIKEKWGGLCVYTNFGTDVINKCIEEYGEKSYTICESCGKPGVLRDDLSWIQTLCDECYKELHAHN